MTPAITVLDNVEVLQYEIHQIFWFKNVVALNISTHNCVVLDVGRFLDLHWDVKYIFKTKTENFE